MGGALPRHWGYYYDALTEANYTVIARGVGTDYSYDDQLWNYHLGVVYDITEQGNVYLSYGTSSEINGGGPVYENSSTRVAQWRQLDSDTVCVGFRAKMRNCC